MAIEWNVGRQTGRCTACGRAFAEGESFQAYLYAADAGFLRRDACLGCQPGGTEGPVACWRTRRPPAGTGKRPGFDREAIHEFFLRLDDASTPEQRQFRFILAILLWRKRMLRFEETTTDAQGRECWRFRVLRDGSIRSVERPDLDEDRIDRLSAQLEGLLADDPGTALAVDLPCPSGDVDA